MSSTVASAGMEASSASMKDRSVGTPKITRKLRGKNTKPGNNVVMSCSASTDDDTKITWFKNGAEFDLPFVTSEEDAKKHRVYLKKKDDDLELVLNDVKSEDAGYYMCVASNKCGEASSMAELTVKG